MQQHDLEQALQTYFHYSQFRTGQKEIIQDVLAGQDVLGILPTGSGKSICYQLPAMLLKGTTIVVSPLISLMIDQEKQLKAKQLKSVVAITSFLSPDERKRIYQQLHTYKLIYVSPEILQQPQLQQLLQKLTISLFVIDEAHCISQWGHEFRPDYLKLTDIIHMLNNPPILALSATATKEVQEDILTILKRPHMVKHIHPIDRKNICFNLQKVAQESEKIDIIVDVLSHHHVPTLIYFSSRQMAEDITQLLMTRLPNRRIAFYHGGMDQMDRLAIQQQFMLDQLDIICCTSAFGMGINKNNIRLIIHYHFPTQLESYIQEVGRAGRDGKSSMSLLLYSPHDDRLSRYIIEQELPNTEELAYVFHQLRHLAEHGKPLPIHEADIEALFKINDVKWRFIHYHLEKNDIIIDNKMIDNPEQLSGMYEYIDRYSQKRMKIKLTKLRDMIRWMQETGCIRERLYSYFQSPYEKPDHNCCSHCGASIWDWQPETTPILAQSLIKSWQSKLKSLLLIGEDHETK